MQIDPLNFAHQDLLTNRLSQLNAFLSEYSFANLYLFRHVHQYEVIQLEDEIFIRGKTRDQVPFIMFTQPPALISSTSLDQVLSLANTLFPIPENWLNLFDQYTPQISFKEEDSDYLYDMSRLSTYQGKHFNGKRNQVHQLLDHHEVKLEMLSHQYAKDAQQILDNWLAEQDLSVEKTDYFSCQEALIHFHQLNLHGIIIYADQKPLGFSIGEWISQECYAIHFSKASRLMKGAYQYLFQEIARLLVGQTIWLNFEQDLGISTLRQAKLSYQPHHLAKKWRVKFSSYRLANI